MSANPASEVLLDVLDSLGGDGAEPTIADHSNLYPVTPTYSSIAGVARFQAAVTEFAEALDAVGDPDELAEWIGELRGFDGQPGLKGIIGELKLYADVAEGKLANTVGRKLNTERWHLETKTASAKVQWDHDLARSRIEKHAQETGEQPLDLLYRVASVGYYRQGALTAEGINADGLKTSEPGRTRVVITEREVGE